ncbi:LCP family protein [Desulfallas sp. Bu1-1]|uniref:LCP family protein n=1 Tax=Desulfallas sp. Bu1-1 TaxID=2787620 RepID=UPI00189F121C|nr:LCP family protein [Desulfallas sp. Bu1-1]MBF7081613.1 LCP family protein [Desulfallas sp. Bu1-1]
MRRKRRLKSKLRFFVFLLLLAGLFSGGFVAANNYLWPWLTGNNLVSKNDGRDEMNLARLDGLNVLMMGVDERQNDKSLRTDTMILANINNKDNRISLLSIPRDTKVNLPGHGVNKINAANLFGGPEMAMDVVSELTGMPVDYYIITNFNGFKGIVDALGGVTVDVEKDMRYHERAYGGAYNIDLQKGVQRLNGDQALMYARYRYDELGDITRTQRQLKLLTAIGEEVMKPGTITKLPRLIPEIYKNVETNMGLKQMVAMARAARNIDNVQIVTQTLPGWFLNENGVSYWYVDPEEAKQVAAALFEEGKVVEVVQGEITRDNNSAGGKQVALEQSRPASRPAGDSDSAGTGNPAPPETAEPAPGPESPASGSEGANSSGSGSNQGPDTGSDTSGTTSQPQVPRDNNALPETGTPPSSGHVQIIINP